jgi:Ca2+:H+ antiporter
MSSFSLRQIRPLDWLLLAVPAAIVLRFVPAWGNETVLFFAAALGIIPLAAWMGRATDHLGDRVGPGMGALLNATFGNAPELLIGLMALSKGLTEVVKASITGSIIGNILLVLGTSIFLGGMRYPHQRYNQTGTRVAATSLALAVIGLTIPTIFHEAVARQTPHSNPVLEHNLSLVIAIILFATYLFWLIFSAFTHRALFAVETSAEPEADLSGTWPMRKAVIVLGVSTAFVAILSEFLAASVESACHALGLTEMFVGVIIVAIVGNAGEHSTAITVALKNKMDLCLGIAIGSSVQIALLITPVLVFASYFLGHPMTLQFSLPEIASIALSVGLVVMISGDGECNWVEGAQLLAVYAILATLFFFLPPFVAPDAPGNTPITAPASP